MKRKRIHPFSPLHPSASLSRPSEVDEEVDQMSRLVDRLLALARADAEGIAIQRRTVDLGLLLADLIEQTRPLAEAKGLTLTAQIAPDPAGWGPSGQSLTAHVDPDAVTQMVLNLLDNAIKYTVSGGVRLSLRATRATRRVSKPQAEGAQRAEPSGEIRIAISDSGPGIPAEHLPHLFERFYRVDRARSRELGGAGLGLAITCELARAHGGDITVDSIPGQGSTFTVHLPRILS